MRRSVVVLAVALFLAAFAPQSFAALLTAGSQYTIQFSSLPLTGPTEYGDETMLAFADTHIKWINGQWVFVGPFDNGTARFDMYENSSDTTPAQSFTSAPGLSSYIFATVPSVSPFEGTISYTPPTWADLEGKLVVSVLSGTVELDSVGVTVYRSGSLYSESFTILAAPVPTPSALFLLGPGLAGLAALKRKFIG